MSIIKQFVEDEQTLKAKKRVYEDVKFPEGFAKFIESLEINGVIKTAAKRSRVEEGHQWINEVRIGGIQLITSEFPLRTTKTVGDVTIIGSKDNLELVHSILEAQGVEFEGAPAPQDIELNIQYHDTLNPKLWTQEEDSYILHEEVQEALEDLSQAFYEFLEMPDLDVEDVTITGSSANFNWTENSDLDIHLVVNIKKAEKKYGKLAVQYFDAIKKVWNDLHDFKIKGIPVEFYVQDDTETHNSTGVYSLNEQDWVIEPKHEEPSVDDNAVKAKAAAWMSTIREITNNCNKADAIEQLMQKLSKLRQAGLDKAGEFSVENLAFKTLRNQGYLDLLADCKAKSFDRELSIEEEQWSTLQ